MIAQSPDGVGVRASLELVIGQLAQTMEKLHKFLTPNPRQSPIVRPIRGVVVSDGSTYVFVNLGGPTAGRYWDLRRLTTIRTTIAAGGQADAFTSVASVIAGLAIRTSAVTNAGAPNLFGFDDLITAGTAANTPRVDNWSAHEVTIRSGQVLVAAIKGTTTGDQYFVSGQAEEYLESTVEVVVA